MNLKHAFSLLALFAAPALPSTITWGTGGTTGFTTGGVNSLTVLDAGGVTGLTLTVTAGVLTGSCAPQCWLTSSSDGFGVDNAAPAGGSSDSSNDLDGSGNPDFISLVFSHTVTLTGATFGNFFSWTDDGVLYNTTSGTVLVTTFDTSSITGLNATGTSFRFQAAGDNDAYRLRSVTIVTNPEPGTIGLTAVGLLGLLAVGRKRLR